MNFENLARSTHLGDHSFGWTSEYATDQTTITNSQRQESSSLVICGFDVTLPQGKLRGRFAYIASLIRGMGLEALTIADGLQWVQMTDYRGNQYCETDDLLYPATPYLTFEDGKLIGMQFVTEKFAILETDFIQTGLAGIQAQEEYVDVVHYHNCHTQALSSTVSTCKTGF